MALLDSLVKHDKKIFKKIKEIFAETKVNDEEILIVGLDEVGRGCLAGPVCTAAYSILDIANSDFAKNKSQKTANEKLVFLNDSKQVNPKDRVPLSAALKKYPQTMWSVDFQPAEAVDKIGIVNCIWNSMTNNIKNILNGFTSSENFSVKKFPKMLVILVDGNKTIFGLEIFLLSEFGKYGLEFVEQISIVKGDTKSAMIAAASNIAKEIRDKYMHELAKDFPQYAWHTNVGYGTEEHRMAIDKHGPCQFHRMSFLGNILEYAI